MTPEQPLDVVLSPACAVRLVVLGPWNSEPEPSNEWRFSLSVVARDSAYHDAILSPTWQRKGPDVLRGLPEGFGDPPGGTLWESDEIWLTAGERRDLVADLRSLQPGK